MSSDTSAGVPTPPEPESRLDPVPSDHDPDPSDADLDLAGAAVDVTPAGGGRVRDILLVAGGALGGVVGTVLVLALVGLLGGSGSGGTALASGSPAVSPGTSATASGGALVTPPPVVAPSTLTPTALASGHALGQANAPVTVEVWADYQCPYCARFSALVEPQIIGTYVTSGKVRFVFRDLAFLGDESRWAAVAARLAEQQGKFWPFHDYLFANQLGENVGSFDVARLKEIASAVGLDRSTFDAGLQLDAARTLYAQIAAESEADAGALGIHSTPSVVVNGSLLDGNDWATIKAAIDAAIAHPGSPAPSASAAASPAG